MVVYTGKIYNHIIKPGDAIALSLNIVILAIFYCFVGCLLSYVLYYFFDEYNPKDKLGLEWEERSVYYQLGDVSLGIGIIALVSFWLVFVLNTSAPIIPVPQYMASFVDTYTTGMFFMYSVFIFMTDLTSKLKYLFQTYLEANFDAIFPNKGSLLDMNLHYE
jgi:hypothetical protein